MEGSRSVEFCRGLYNPGMSFGVILLLEVLNHRVRPLLKTDGEGRADNRDSPASVRPGPRRGQPGNASRPEQAQT